MSGASNYTPLEQNVLSYLDEIGAAAFMWARERLMNDRLAYKAEAFANEVQHLWHVNQHFFGIAVRLHNEGVERGDPHYPGDLIENESGVIDRLCEFVMDRHAAFRFPGEKRSWTRRADLRATFCEGGAA